MQEKPNSHACFWVCVIKHGLGVDVDGVNRENIKKNGGNLDILGIIEDVEERLHGSERKFRKSFVHKDSTVLKFSENFVNIIRISLQNDQGVMEERMKWLGCKNQERARRRTELRLNENEADRVERQRKDRVNKAKQRGIRSQGIQMDISSDYYNNLVSFADESVYEFLSKSRECFHESVESVKTFLKKFNGCPLREFFHNFEDCPLKACLLFLYNSGHAYFPS